MTSVTFLEETRKAQAALQRAGIDIAVLSSVGNVTYAIGVEVPVPVGAGAELTIAPWLALFGSGGDEAVLLAPGGAAGVAAKHGFQARPFDIFDSFTPNDPRGTYVFQLRAALRQLAGPARTGTVGIETRSLSVLAFEAIKNALPDWRIVDVEPALLEARWIKTDREIAMLRDCSALADRSHTTLAAQCRVAGVSEFDMFAAISRDVFAGAGRDIPLTGELVTGPRTTTVEYPNGPRNRIIAPGDAALMDLSGRFNGYWFDCTSTHVIGGVEPSADQRRYGLAAQAACEAAMNALRPGARASDAAAAAEAAFATFGLPMAHYAGHQIGVAVNEFPRLVPYDHSTIEAGMVFSVEPGAYMGPGGNFGARAEKMVLVTPSGPEILSTFSWGIT